MVQVKCTVCGKLIDRELCTPLKGLGATPDGWECPECDEAASNATHIETEVARGMPMGGKE